jgi:hypothetical protein
MSGDLREAIAKSKELVDRAVGNLALVMLTNCPLPHEFVQRRDGMGPWCEACGYAANGERVREMGA